MLILFLMPAFCSAAPESGPLKGCQKTTSPKPKKKKKLSFEELLAKSNFGLEDKQYQLLLLDWQKTK